MYYARLRSAHCVGCGRALAAAAARCPYCGTHAKYSHGAYARPHTHASDRNLRSAAANRSLDRGGSNEPA